MKAAKETHLDRMTQGYLTAAACGPDTPLDQVHEVERVQRDQVDDDAWQAARSLCAAFATTSPALVSGLAPGIAGYCLYRSQRGERHGFLNQVDVRVPEEPQDFECAQGLTPRETKTVWWHNERMREAHTAAAAVPRLALSVAGERLSRRLSLASGDAGASR